MRTLIFCILWLPALSQTNSVNSPTLTLPTSTAALTSTPVLTGTVTSNSWTKFKVTGQPILKLTIVGSSTSAGFGPTVADSAYVRRLRKFYIDNGIITDVTNLAVGGTTVFDVAITTALDTDPDVLLVNYPSNGFNGSTFTMSQISAKFQEIKDSCDNRGVIFYTTGTQPRDDFSAPDRVRLNTINDTLRNRFGARFIDFLLPVLNTSNNTIKTEFSAGDGVHVNNAAHRHLFELVKAKNIFQSYVSTTPTISSPTSQNTNVTGHTVGTYYYQSSFVTSEGFAASAISTVTVLQEPYAIRYTRRARFSVVP